MYKNPHEHQLKRGWAHFVLWQLGYYKDSMPSSRPPEGFTYPNPESLVDLAQPTISWLNHSTFLISAYGKTFLTDPIWNDRCSPVSFLGPKRHHAPPLSIEQLVHVDFVIISHDHYDHLDHPTIGRLLDHFPQIQWIMPARVKKWFSKHFPQISEECLIELDWWESYQGGDVTFTAVPAQHFSGRGLFNRNATLWMGCVVDVRDKRFYFAGDTGYNGSDFKEIGRRFGQMDLSLIPIGSYLPRRFMQSVHVQPEESVRIHKEVASKLSVGGHFGTFRLSSEPLDRPPYDLFLAMEKEGISCDRFRVLSPGQRINW